MLAPVIVLSDYHKETIKAVNKKKLVTLFTPKYSN